MAFRLMVAGIPPALHVVWIICIQAFAGRLLAEGCKVGTACSGSDLVMKIVNVMRYVIIETHGILFQFDHGFSCERNEKKRNFISSQFFGTLFLFGLVANLVA